mmetsp:Transcript_57277/g.100326  ORF Transcript_57277/g.100326 Transcript_57277/m.100326 type:complete len:439 (-) Transcript_57277:56-1372(-)
MTSKEQLTPAADVAAGAPGCEPIYSQASDAMEHPLTKAFVSAAPAPSKLRAAAQALLLALLYIVISAAMIMFNKFMMRSHVFPFAVTLTSMHQLSALILATVLRQAAPWLFPTAHVVFGRPGQKDAATYLAFGQPQAAYSELRAQTPMERVMELAYALLPFSPIAVCGAVSLVAGNSAYKHASVAFLQMVKESQIVTVYLFSLMAGLETFHSRRAIVLAFITASAVVAVYGEVYFSRTGLILQLIAGVCGSGQIVLNNRLMSQSAGPKIDPLTMVLCTAPVMLAALVPANFVVWEPRIPILMIEWAPHIICNCMLAFALQVATAVLIKNISGTGFALACVSKDLSIVAAAASLLHEHLSLVQVSGFAGTILGMCLYVAMKVYPAAFEPAKEECQDKESSVSERVSSSSSSSSTRTPSRDSRDDGDHARQSSSEGTKLS